MLKFQLQTRKNNCGPFWEIHQVRMWGWHSSLPSPPPPHNNSCNSYKSMYWWVPKMMQGQRRVSGALVKVLFVNLTLLWDRIDFVTFYQFILPVITPVSTISRLTFCNHVFTPNIVITPPPGGGGALSIEYPCPLLQDWTLLLREKNKTWYFVIETINTKIVKGNFRADLFSRTSLLRVINV